MVFINFLAYWFLPTLFAFVFFCNFLGAESPMSNQIGVERRRYSEKAMPSNIQLIRAKAFTCVSKISICKYISFVMLYVMKFQQCNILSFSKQIIKHHFALNNSAVLILFQAVCAYKCLMYCLLCFGCQTKTLGTLTQVFIVLLGDFKLAL